MNLREGGDHDDNTEQAPGGHQSAREAVEFHGVDIHAPGINPDSETVQCTANHGTVIVMLTGELEAARKGTHGAASGDAISTTN